MLAPGIEAFPLRFTGTGGEFFRVWIVNVLLSIVTLGFYTPFARRRTAQYFFSHTDVAGSPLEFTAQQRKMVIGFLVLVGLYIAFNVASETGQDATVAFFMLAGAVLAPYFWASAMRFRLSATRWRGLRLQFAPSWGEVYKASWPVFVIALVWIGVSFAAGVLFEPSQATGRGPRLPKIPGVFWLAVAAALVATVLCTIRLEFNYKSLLVLRARIGGESGRWKPVYGDFVRIWLATLGVLFLSMLTMVALIAGVVFLFVGKSKVPADLGSLGFALLVLVPLAALVGMLVAIAPVRAYREARMFQLVWNNVGVSQIARFKCDLSAWRYVLLRIRNVLLTVFTLGFWRPFARVSEHRMRTESVTLHVKGGLDQLAGRLARQQEGGVGDALADAVGLDLVG
ncbi:YjgN family protein [Ramlibacter sp. PS4R-6]|uniref:YjgN family protein n=1 Tax=Ramlibacter sp. PS4R-6 TaxID=3133438 RepID=UPI0030A90E88